MMWGVSALRALPFPQPDGAACSLCVLHRLTDSLPTDHSTLPPVLTARPTTLLCGLAPTPERGSTFLS